MQPNLYKHPHHNIINSALEFFDAEFFESNRIPFGGGTRIALELDEYRESIDIDFLCQDRESYRAVREQVSSNSLGQLVKKEFVYLREISFDRYAVRTYIEFKGATIKLEIVSCDQYDLVISPPDLFPVPYLHQSSCFYTKLLAHADRPLAEPFKDIFDLLMMFKCWGVVPSSVWSDVNKIYGSVALRTLVKGLNDVIQKPKTYEKTGVKHLKISPELAKSLVYELPNKFLATLPAIC